MTTGVGRQGRIATIDVVRIVALVAVVTGHVYTDSEFVERLVQSWRLPIFFMLTGYFWSARRGLLEEVQRRVRSLLLPYVCWLVLISLVIVLLGTGSIRENAGTTIRPIFLGGSAADRPYTTFWFFTALFSAIVVYRVLTLYAPTWLRLLVVAVGLAANIVAGDRLDQVPFSVASGMAALVFMEVGVLVRRAQLALSRPQLAALAVAALILAVALVAAPTDFTALGLKNGTVPPLAVLARSFHRVTR